MLDCENYDDEDGRKEENYVKQHQRQQWQQQQQNLNSMDDKSNNNNHNDYDIDQLLSPLSVTIFGPLFSSWQQVLSKTPTLLIASHRYSHNPSHPMMIMRIMIRGNKGRLKLLNKKPSVLEE